MIYVKELSADNFNDFASLMKTDAQCSECWCLNHRESGGCVTGDAAQEKMRQLTSQGKVSGLLAFSDQDCIGWIAIDPMTELIGHDCFNASHSKEWSIHCIFVRDGFRGQGVSTALINAAINFAKVNGASLISAFPIPMENRQRFPLNEAEFSGRFSTYLKLGFRPVEKKSDFYQRMELLT